MCQAHYLTHVYFLNHLFRFTHGSTRTEIHMATATTAPAAKTGDKKNDKTEKQKKEPKPMLTRLDEQVTRAVIAKKLTLEEMTKFAARVEKLKALLEE